MHLARRQPRLWLLTAGLLTAAFACSLPGGQVEPTPTFAEPTAPPATPTATPEPTPDLSGLCPTATAELALHLDPNNGVCFLYPSHYEVSAGFERPERVVTLIGPTSEPIGQKAFAVILAVEHNGPDEGMTATSYADRAIELFNYPTDGVREEISVAGVPATVLHGLPGAFVSERRAYLVVNGERYVLSLIPESGEIPDLTEESNQTWNTLLDSITFFPPTDPPTYISSDEVCPSPGADTQVRVDLVDGYCYLHPSDFAEAPDLPDQIVGGPVLGTFSGFGEVRTSLTLGTFGSFPGTTPLEMLEPRFFGVDPASVSERSIGGWPAVVFRNTDGPWDSRNAIIVVDGFVYTIVNQPWEPEMWPDGIPWLDQVWDVVTETTAFFSRWR